jgi:hypothetical protein
MSRKTISDAVKNQVEDIVKRFNASEMDDPNCFYLTRYRGKFLYLDRKEYGSVSNICRLEYTGDMENWYFAIYKYSDGRYDPEEILFSGDQHVDGTIEGAMRAGLEAYPD